MLSSTYQKSDFKRLSWEEYGQILETLYQKLRRYLEENHIKVDAVVPILRGGGVPGTVLAYKLHLLKILPVQYKYLSKGKELELHNLTFIPENTFKITDNPIFLVVENNHCFGGTSKQAIADLKRILPNCKVIYAATTMDYSYQEMGQAEAVFYGKLTNETRKLSEKDAKETGLNMDLTLFPWEDLEEEWSAVTEQVFKYGSL